MSGVRRPYIIPPQNITVPPSKVTTSLATASRSWFPHVLPLRSDSIGSGLLTPASSFLKKAIELNTKNEKTRRQSILKIKQARKSSENNAYEKRPS
ncbi:hypothetical protein HHI36_022164 [Cryptolaemus montrouzieri]|uniref:Uncharacterized protein n=1 Tax=Cryptolaemus montrouzieri TaxID=559131 RepID=A0ABD2MZS8_9CUCU